MRSSVWGLVLAIAALGACTQQLGMGTFAPGHGGAGGRVAGAGAGGASANPGTGNAPGTGTGAVGWSTSDAAVPGDGSAAAMCDAFVAQYQAAMVQAQTCGLGSTGQCQQIVSAHLSACDSCRTYVNDATNLLAITAAWEQAGCSMMAAGQTCGQGPCMTPTNNTCVDLGNGSGTCAFATSTGGGGASGAAADAGAGACADLAAQYDAALVAAQSCTVSSAGQCEQTVPTALGPCFNNCLTYVNATSELNSIRSQWQSLGCDSVTPFCSGNSCPGALGSTCVGSPGSTGSCTQTAFASAPGG